MTKVKEQANTCCSSVVKQFVAIWTDLTEVQNVAAHLLLIIALQRSKSAEEKSYGLSFVNDKFLASQSGGTVVFGLAIYILVFLA